jgi:uncharacterized protein
MNTVVQSPLSRPIIVADVPGAGMERTVEANEIERLALAADLDIPAVKSLVAHFRLFPWKRGGLRIKGTLEATVVQTCVLTLDPLQQSVREEIDLRLLPENEVPAKTPEIEIDATAEDPPEPIVGGVVDLGTIAAEHLALGLDPYPRTPGIAFEGDGEGDEISPFAALAALKPGTLK